MKLPRFKRIVLLSLLAGLLLSFGVAWGAWLFAPQSKFVFLSEWSETAWPISVPEDWPDNADLRLTTYDQFGFGYKTSTHTTDPDLRKFITYAPGRREIHSYSIVVDQIGWPFFMLSGWERFEYHDQQKSTSMGMQWVWSQKREHSGIAMLTKQVKGLGSNNVEPMIGSRYYLPTMLDWLPMLANWLFWSVVLAILLLVPWAIRLLIAWRRRRAGLCIRCKYDLTGLDQCPECGTQVEPLIPLRMRVELASTLRNEP